MVSMTSALRKADTAFCFAAIDALEARLRGPVVASSLAIDRTKMSNEPPIAMAPNGMQNEAGHDEG